MFDYQIKRFRAWESELAKKHAARHLLWGWFKKLVSLIPVTIISIWIKGFYSRWKWGWFVTGLYWLAIIFFVIVFVVALKKTGKRGFLFWQPWLLAFGLGIVFLVFEVQGNIPPNKQSLQFLPPSQQKTEQNPKATNYANWSDMPEHDKNLFLTAFAAGQAAHRLMQSSDWDNAVKPIEECYQFYFQLSIGHPEYWPSAADASGAMANVYSHLPNRKDDSELADEATRAIRRILLNSPPNTNATEMKPAVDLFNKLKNVSR